MSQIRLEQLLRPLPDNVTGADPRHSDAFQLVKQHIEKMSGADYQLVQQQCQLILSEQAWVLAATQLQGVTGFIEAIEAYQLLIAQFGEKLYPQRLDAKIAALKWLNNSRLNIFLENLANLSAVQMERLLLLVPAFNATIKQFFLEDLSLFANLTAAIHLQRQKQQVKWQEKKSSENIPRSNNYFNSYAEIENGALGIIRYYQQKNNLIAAAMQARALRWGDMKLPPHEEYQTKIPAPRTQGLVKLDNLINAGDAQEIYLYCEELFLEPSYHFLLDLQYYSYHAAKSLADEQLALYLENAIKDLLKRFPVLIELQFDNQKPFATVSSKTWLYEILNENHATLAGESEVTADLVPESIIHLAKKKSTKKNLPTLINYIVALEVNCGFDEFQKKHAMAKLCLEYKRHDIALAILGQLEIVINQHQLNIWQPELALAVWLDLFNALNFLLKKTTDNSKVDLQEKIAYVRQQISQLDIVQAMQLF